MSGLRFDNVSFRYTETPCISGFSCSLSKGELVGLIGANGSGKSTLLRLGTGLLSPSSGTVELDGKPVKAWRGHERAARLSYLPQSIEVPLPFLVRELVEIGSSSNRHNTGFSVSEALEATWLDNCAEKPLSHLSGGERRRAFIAMTLAQGGSTILLDEPLAGLDLRYQYDILTLLGKIAAEYRLGILLTLHDLLLTKELDRLLVIKQGQLLADGRPELVLTTDLIQNTFDIATDSLFFSNSYIGKT